MRILLLSQYYAPEVGAPQHRWSGLARCLTAAGHELHVVAPAPHYPHGHLLPEHRAFAPGRTHAGDDGEVVHRVRFRPYDERVRPRMADEAVVASAAVAAVRRGLGGWRPEVVVATVPSLPMLWAGGRAARHLGVPFVAEVRDAWPDLLVVADDWDHADAHGRPSLPARAARRGMSALGAATTRLQRRADAVVVTTDAFAQVLRARGVEPVHVVRNAAHELPGWPDRPAGAEHHDGVLRILYGGTVGRAQGLATALRAAALAKARGVRLELRVVGAGADRRGLEALTRELGAPVQWCDPVPRSRMTEHYAWCDTVLVSLRGWAALEMAVPSKLYEVMGLGVHVTAVVAGEAREIVEGRHAGAVSTPGDVEQLADTWERLAADRTLLEVSALGRAWVAENARPDALADAYVGVLDSVVTRRGA